MRRQYFTVFQCSKCYGVLTDIQRRHNNGRCPHCGWRHATACTIASTVERAAFLEPRPWWKFWQPRRVVLMPFDFKGDDP